ncbi:MAG: L-2-hydroxyglutarate oxidase [Desulfovibrionaceae bacterium]|nr:L-2-hydroxyglutarate oxidase [Desulfovibrionaceae bacterium]
MNKASVLICGAGIIGLTLARRLIQAGRRDILIFEKEPAPGRHASGRNSGVLHAGVYYDPGTLKARFCLKGNKLMRAYCRERGLPLVESGKVVVARSEDELPVLRELYKRAVQNGADVALIDEAELAEIEPNARTTGLAMHSRDTAVIDPGAILEALRKELAASRKVRFMFSTRFTGLAGPDCVQTDRGALGFELFINAAGAYSDRVAQAFGLGRGFRLAPFKGVYRRLKKEKSHLVRGSIYPVPNIKNPFLGVHLTRNAHGEVYLGPTAIPALGRENYGILKGLDSEWAAILALDAALFVRNAKFRGVALEEPRKYLFPFLFRDAKALVKELDPSDVEPSPKVGIRPQLVDLKKGELVMDFKVERGENSVHVLNSISPAFTSSMAFADMVVTDYCA